MKKIISYRERVTIQLYIVWGQSILQVSLLFYSNCLHTPFLKYYNFKIFYIIWWSRQKAIIDGLLNWSVDEKYCDIIILSIFLCNFDKKSIQKSDVFTKAFFLLSLFFYCVSLRNLRTRRYSKFCEFYKFEKNFSKKSKTLCKYKRLNSKQVE